MAKHIEYGTYGRVGVIVPPANTTVEPELISVIPEGISLHFTRLPGRVSNETAVGLRERFDGYTAHLSEAADSFGGCQLSATCLAVTGSSYLVGARGEASLLADLRAGGAPQVVTAALAIQGMLKELKCKRIGLVTPYPSWVVELAKEYWSQAGFEVVHIVPLPDVVSIYSISTMKVVAAVEEIQGSADADAIVLSGTGVATIPAIESLIEKARVPVISSNLCLAWWIITSLGVAVEPQSVAPAIRALARWMSDRAGALG